MKHHKFLITFFLFFSVLTSLSQNQNSWIRYNVAGYDLERPKNAVVMSDVSLKGTSWQIKNVKNITVASGILGDNHTGRGLYMPKDFNYTIDFSILQLEGNYTLTVGNSLSAPILLKCHPYKSLLSQILRTIRVRRSGSANALDHGISHFGDSSCAIYRRSISNSANLELTNSGSESWKVTNPMVKANMLGGYYDAGDYIKFTLTNAYLTYFMLRSYETAPELFDGVKTYSTTSLDDLLDNAKWGLDFLLRTMPNGNEFIIQTGGQKDHEQQIRLPENDLLNGKRECYSALSPTQMGLTAASLALGSKIFAQKGWLTLSEAYKTKAIHIYTAAKNSTAPNAWWQTNAAGGEIFYADRSENDNMELAAIELYLLTQQNSFLADAISYGNAAGAAYWASWADLNLHAHLRTYPYHSSMLSFVNNDLNSFLSNTTHENNLWRIPHAPVWGSLYSQLSVANAAIDYFKVTSKSSYLNISYDVVDYLMGKNAWGLCFVATKDFSNTIKSSFATIYRLQPEKFPHGEIAEGPAGIKEYNNNSKYFNPSHNPNLWHKEFNTDSFTFFEQPGDYISMETTISGLADGLYLLTLASKNFCEKSLLVNEGITMDSKQPIYISYEEQSTFLNINDPMIKSYDLKIYDLNDKLITTAENQKDTKLELNELLSKGSYIVALKSSGISKSFKVIIKE